MGNLDISWCDNDKTQQTINSRTNSSLCLVLTIYKSIRVTWNNKKRNQNQYFIYSNKKNLLTEVLTKLI